MDLSQNCEGCKYRENNDSCSKLVKTMNGRSVLCNDSEADNCMSLECPEKCYLPYPKDFYEDAVSTRYYTDDGGKLSFSTLDEIKNDIDRTNSFKVDLSANVNQCGKCLCKIRRCLNLSNQFGGPLMMK